MIDQALLESPIEQPIVHCAFCDIELNEENKTTFDGQTICLNCHQSETCVCTDCGNRIWREDRNEYGTHVLCDSCYDMNYTHCSLCRELLRNENAYYNDEDEDTRDSPYCYSCLETLEKDRVIQSYNYKPSPIFYGEGLFLGVEIELDGAGEDEDNASRILQIGNAKEPKIYIKHDGSLEAGFEIVTHPMDLHHHMYQMDWKGILSEAIHMGYKSHQAGTCGLHTHVNRSALGKTLEEQEQTIARILYFIERHWHEMLRFSRRTEAQINRWASRYGLHDTPKETLQNAKTKNIGRYACVNLSNWATIEIRIFRGTLKVETFIATLQMVDQICRVAITLSDEAFREMTWQEFVSNIQADKSALIEYLKMRKLYLDESVEGQEEI